jgi:hypothetical protein
MFSISHLLDFQQFGSVGRGFLNAKKLPNPVWFFFFDSLMGMGQ